jgi:hypothetical protein
MGGYAYPYADSTSTACLNSSVFCGAGMAATGGAYGAGLGVNLNQPTGAMTMGTFAVPAGKLGVSYALSTAPPAKTVLIIDNNSVAYQASITAASAMVPWAMFMVQTADAGPPTLSAAPTASHVQFQIGSGGSFNFCVTALSFY